LIITFNFSANQSAVRALVRNLTFRNISENPTILPRTVQVQLTDGDGGISVPVTKTINVIAVNDAPVVSGFVDPAAYFIAGTPVIVDFDATISDADSSNFDTGSLTVSLTTNKQSTDRLSVASIGDGPGQVRTAVNSLISSLMDVFYEGLLIGTYPVSSTTTLKVTLNSSSSSTAVGALLRRVTFYSTSATPPTALRTVQVLLNDGDGKTSIVAAKTISINAPVTPTGVWTNGSPTANLSNNHLLGAATPLPNGTVIVAGGHGGGSTAIRTAEIYNPVTRTWSATGLLGTARWQLDAITLDNGKALFAGGASETSQSSVALATAELYDRASGTFSPTGNNLSVGRQGFGISNLLPTTLKDMKAFELYNGRVFIAAGQNTVDGVTTDATWLFDIGSMQFTPGPSMVGFNYAVSGPQVGTSDYSAFDLFPVAHPLHGRYVLFAGGENDPLVGPDVELNSASIYDALQNRFFNVGPTPFTHDDHTESLLLINAAGNPEVLLFGGGQTLGTSRFEFLFASLL